MIDFLGIGAQKSGTTWVYRHLSRHRQLWLPETKELHYWDHDPDGDGAAWLDVFAAAPEDRRKGEYTPAYATLKMPTIERIAKIAPDLRLIYVLRNPIERAWSQARMVSQTETLDLSSEAAVRDFLASERCRSRNSYSQAIDNWRAVFGHDALVIYLTEDIAERPEDVLSGLARHLDVDPDEYALDGVDLRSKVHVGLDMAMPSYVRDVLTRELRDEILGTAERIGRPLDHWFP